MARSRAATAVRRETSPTPSPPPRQIADSIGLPIDPSNPRLFGFNSFAELWTGRLAMMGFALSCGFELAGRGGTLAQLGFEVPSPALFTTLSLVFGGLTAAATVKTLADAATGGMPAGQARQYASFFGVDKEGLADIDAAGAALKSNGDFTSPDSVAAIAAARSATPADAILGKDDDAVTAAAATALRAADSALTVDGDAAQIADAAARLRAAPAAPPSIALAGRADAVETLASADAFAAAWARDVEINNGRWAMVGFLAAVLVESATGHGVFGQLIDFFKLVGLLGDASGF